MREVMAHNIIDFHQKLKALPEAYKQVSTCSIEFLLNKYLVGKGRALIIGSCHVRLQQTLRMKGYKVELFDDQTHALNKFEHEVYDTIIVLDEMQKYSDLSERLKFLFTIRCLLRDGGTTFIMYDNAYGTIKTDLLYPAVFKGHFMITPDLAKEELAASGLHLISYAGAESMVSGMYLELNRLKAQSITDYNRLLQVASQSCEKTEYRDCTEHLIFVLRK